ncbi:MAG: methyltransferase domain-containing protein [Candidatus Staskawiczbacteria bacterium]|nr:methyltransferase domain-containing protein [Candidatus Staskawiczbacteria bacterium]
MQENEIENKIIRRFDEFSHIFLEEIDLSDFRIKKILKFLGKPSDGKILDVGCGKGRFCRKIKDFGFINIIGVEPSKELIKAARKNNKDIEFVQASAGNLPFMDDEFDFLICIEVLSQIPNTEKSIKEMARVLKRNGEIIIIDKNKASIHPKFFLPLMFFKKYMEISNKWFYPRDFQFREKWFFPWEIEKMLKKYCRKTEKEYLMDNKRKMFGFLPFLNLFIAWRGIKQ